MTDPVDEFAAALRRRLEEMGRSQSWLGAEVARHEGREDPYSQPAVSAWLSGRNSLEPSTVFAMERALQLSAGSLSRLLGFLPTTAKTARSVRAAVEADPRLTASGRRVLLAVYEELVAGGADGSDA